MCIQFYLPFPHRQQLLLNSFFFIYFSAYLFLEELAEVFFPLLFLDFKFLSNIHRL